MEKQYLASMEDWSISGVKMKCGLFSSASRYLFHVIKCRKTLSSPPYRDLETAGCQVWTWFILSKTEKLPLFPAIFLLALPQKPVIFPLNHIFVVSYLRTCLISPAGLGVKTPVFLGKWRCWRHPLLPPLARSDNWIYGTEVSVLPKWKQIYLSQLLYESPGSNGHSSFCHLPRGKGVGLQSCYICQKKGDYVAFLSPPRVENSCFYSIEWDDPFTFTSP